MIGKYIRSLRHLKRSLTLNTPQKILCMRRDTSFMECTAIKVMHQDNEYLMLFNPLTSTNERIMSNILNSDNDIVQSLSQAHSYCIVEDKIDRSIEQLWHSSFTHYSALLLPITFNEDYQLFCDNNKKTLSSLFNNYMSSSNPMCKYTYALCNGSANIFLWIIKNFTKSIPFHLLNNMLYWFDNYNQFNGKLSKGTMTAYNEWNIFKLRDELLNLRKTKRISSVINMFNTAQKKALRGVTLTLKQENILSRFDALSKEKQHNFIRKVSTIENVEEIFHQMALLVKTHFEWKRESFFDFIHNVEGLDFSIVYDDKNIVILNVKNYDTIKYVTKTTNWCISKNKRYWDEYMVRHRANNHQYVLFDFNKKEDHEYSIIGFTVKGQKSITHAHSFTNANLMRRENGTNFECSTFLTSTAKNIHNILHDLNIPLDIFISLPSLPYEWGKENIMSILNDKIGEENFEILSDDNDKMSVLIESSNVSFLVGSEQYAKVYENVGQSIFKRKHILFFDFSKTSQDKLLWGYAEKDGDIEYVPYLYDSSGTRVKSTFNYIAYTYGLPFNVIIRPNYEGYILQTAFKYYDIQFLMALLTQESFQKVLNDKKDEYRDYIIDVFEMMAYQAYSFDFINLLYDNNIQLSKVIGERGLNAILSRLVMNLRQEARSLKKVPTECDYERLNNHEFSYNQSFAMGFFFMIDEILKNEPINQLINDWINEISRLPNSLIKNYFMDVLTQDMSKITTKMKITRLVQMINRENYYQAFDNILTQQLTTDTKRKIFDILNDTHPYKQKFMLEYVQA